ncbi:MAG: SDR family oxidoreductase [Verrucomicrobia bacterium]|nr:SDR family oxidoreductase [Verrucomicrobiota bacterium]
MRVLIVGCGYVGLPLGAELARLGHEVFGLRRSAGGEDALIAAGIKPLIGDVSKSETLAPLPGPFDWVVNCVSSGKGGAAEYREIYLNGTRHLIEWLAPTPLKKFVYTSSTSVYGQTDSSLVKESSSTQPQSETSQVLVETEKLLLDAASARKFPAVILRVAGIYGPERGHLYQQYLRDEARIAGKGERLINMVHRDDVVACIITALKSGKPGEVYNAVDDEPVTQLHFFRWLSETLGKDLPPFATEEENAARKRGLTQKKVSNRKARMEMGWQLKYPTFRHGYSAEIKRTQDGGMLDAGK